jgi:hypothetical protein
LRYKTRFQKIIDAGMAMDVNDSPETPETPDRPGFPELSGEAGRKLVEGLAVEAWRFGRVFQRLLARADAADRGRFEGQLRWFMKKVEEALSEAGMQIVMLEGNAFDMGMPAKPVNIEDFEAGERLTVDQMLEPVIVALNGGGVLRYGTVTLKRPEGGPEHE